MKEAFFSGELQLLSWSETSNGGAKIVLALADPSELEVFKTITCMKGKQAGQRIGAAFVLIGDDEKPQAVEGKKGGVLAMLAAQLCGTERFQIWIEDAHTSLWVFAKRQLELDDNPCATREEIAAAVVRMGCKISSRSELDHDPAAADTFHQKFRIPYVEWQQKQNRHI